jgi:uncharacterized protein YecT (DUF1311 family)
MSRVDTVLEELIAFQGWRKEFVTRRHRKLQIFAALVLTGSALQSVILTALAGPVGECQAATSNQIETGQCLRDTLGAAEQVMTLALAHAQSKADSIDQVTGRSGARPALDQSQAVWLQFRDLNCAVPGAFAAGGSGSGQFVVSCEMDMTRARTVELDALASGA